MKNFAALFKRLDETTKTTLKVNALADYFAAANDADKLWTIALLSHRRPKRTVNTRLLRQWSSEAANIPLWLFEETYHIVGDLAETITLLIEQNAASDYSLTYWIEKVIALKDRSEEEKRTFILNAWSQLDTTERFVFNKIITDNFRVGVSQKIMVKGLSKATGIEENELMFRISGDWTPQEITFEQLLFPKHDQLDLSKPYPFYLAYALEKELPELGNPEDWQVEYKWDGIRGQLIHRDHEIFLWSRGEELITDKFPELEALKNVLPNGVVIDGEILPWKNDGVMGFNDLQTRIGRKSVSEKLKKDVPIILMAYDLLEFEGKDFREQPLQERRAFLEKLVKKLNHPNLLLSEKVDFKNWAELNNEDARALRAEGYMLKSKYSVYEVGRKKGNWWKWKVDPYTVDAVLTYAMRGHGRRAGLYTDYTFGLWHNGELVTFAKAYSGLTDAEIRQVDAFVKRNTIDKFGPVRQVTPKLVFEIAFEGIAKSTRHKSGFAVRFPRIHRWRQDKSIEEANTLQDLEQLIEVE